MKELESVLFRWRFFIVGAIAIILGVWLGYLPRNPEEFRALLDTISNLIKR